ncbi:hypothetical protein ACFOWX_11205 [Sphingorhabdus arenilitoris]|uniref:Secreted protein n=1 Tax=Sphingorhabdus arenilitoris TaxID=1490041 RepID=A0ABV8RL39_9SPHN
MFVSLLLLLQAAPPVPPAPPSAPLAKPLDKMQMQTIGCIATLGLVAYDQKRGDSGVQRFPDVTERGRKYAGIMGDRIVFESGQPKEVVALAIRQSVRDQQQMAINAANDAQRMALWDRLMGSCLPLLDAEVPVQQKVTE